MTHATKPWPGTNMQLTLCENKPVITLVFGPPDAKPAVSCKRCIKILAREVEQKLRQRTCGVCGTTYTDDREFCAWCHRKI